MGRSYFSSYWELKFNIMTDIFSQFKLWRQGAFIVIVIYLKYLQGFQERTSLSIIFFYVSQKKKSDIFWVLIGVTFPVVIPRKAAFHEPKAPSFHFVLLFYERGWWWKGINEAFLHVWFNLKAWKTDIMLDFHAINYQMYAMEISNLSWIFGSFFSSSSIFIKFSNHIAFLCISFKIPPQCFISRSSI